METTSLSTIAFIQQVFDSYTTSFKDSLNKLQIWPWTNEKTVIHESNQVHRFLEEYSKTGKNIVSWTELPIYYKGGYIDWHLAHIDAFIVDIDRKIIIFIEAKRLSQPRQLSSLKTDVDRFYKIAKEIYVGNGNFRGINLFEYDAYLLTLADVWEYRGSWCQSIATDWKTVADELEGVYGLTLATMKDSMDIPGMDDSGQYHLLGALMKVFYAEDYKKAVIMESNDARPASDPSILTYSDDIPFETLLALVNKKQ